MSCYLTLLHPLLSTALCRLIRLFQCTRSSKPHATGLSQQSWKATLCRYRLQPEVVLLKEVAGEEADALAAELPGLVTVQGSDGDRKAVVAAARQHEKLLEKVCKGHSAHAYGLTQRKHMRR